MLINTAGGVTGGDRFRWTLEAEARADLVVTTQAAERAYQSQPGLRAEVETRLALEEGATLHWLPQETIPFDRSALVRRLEIDMAENASLIAVESVIFGRRAMCRGRLTALGFADHWRIRRGGRLIYADAIRLRDADALADPACLGGAGAMVSVVMAAPNATDRIDGARTRLADEPGVEAGASAFDGLLVMRLLAEDGYRLRPALARLLAHLGGRPPPRVWAI